MGSESPDSETISQPATLSKDGRTNLYQSLAVIAAVYKGSGMNPLLPTH